MAAWLGLGVMVWTSPADVGIDTLPEGTQYVLSLVCAAMIFVLWQIQTGTDIAHEQSVQGKFKGYPGASSKSWTEWGPKPNNNKKPTSAERQAAYRETLHDTTDRALRKGAYRNRR